MDYISIDLLKPHPKNPRKDIGDITELSESIKENGIMQNLTVIDDNDGTYTVIIGHRRLAAARAAGLDKVPCIVVDMDEATQQSTMLLENMQRVDLTPYEQAEGFQMCLDLGMNEDDLKQKTGFSKKTIKHRLNMLKYDKLKVKKCIDSGASLQDFIELEKLENEKTKNKLLAYMGTSEFSFKLNQAINDEKTKKQLEKCFEILDTFAECVKKEPYGYRYAHYYYVSDNQEITIPEDAGAVSYKYVVHHNAIYLYKEDPERKDRQLAEERAREAADNRRNSLREVCKTALETRKSFMKDLYQHSLKNFDEHIKKYAVMCMLCNFSINDFDEELFSYITGKKIELEESIYTKKEWKRCQLIMEGIDKNLNATVAAIVYCRLEEPNNLMSTAHYDGSFNENNTNLKRVYDFLGLFGYTMSAEEASLLDGTHELYFKDEGE